MTAHENKDRRTGRTLADLIYELIGHYLWVAVGVIVVVVFGTWAITHILAEPGGQVSVLGIVQYTKKGQTKALPSSDTNVTQSTVTPSSGFVVDFSSVDTPSAPGHIVAAAPYLHDFGISVADREPQGSKIVLINNLVVYQGDAVRPTTSQNLLTQVDTDNVKASFTLVFSESAASVSFTRPALYPATKSGITHPAWSAHALNAAGEELSSQIEGLIKSYEDVPARQYTLRAPGVDVIKAVRFESDPRLEGKPFAAFSAILIERLTLNRRHAKPTAEGK